MVNGQKAGAGRNILLGSKAAKKTLAASVNKYGAEDQIGRGNYMNVFEEFNHLVKELETSKVRYALVGGVAMAFYSEPRFTRDIDLLIDCEDYEKTKGILENDGYFESASPWTFRKAPIELHRFLKVIGEDEMMIDILIAGTEEVRRIISDSLEAESEEGKVRIANKKDLIWLKSIRGSKQDQADIEKLEDE